MHKALLAVPLFVALALSGCSGGSEHKVEDFTCPDGTVIDHEAIEAAPAHHDDGFDAASLCPVAPKVTLTGLPVTIQAYHPAAFSWGIDPGSVEHGHSMITEIRYAASAVPDAQASLTTYNKQVIKKEHQDLPVTFKGNVTFNQVGKVYLRAYAAVQGEGFDRRDVWGPEVVLDVVAVKPTGTVATVTHEAGLILGALSDDFDANLGDAIQFENKDLLMHTLTQTSAPVGAAECALEAASNGMSATTCALLVPGSYEFTTDDVQPQVVKVNVKAPK